MDDTPASVGAAATGGLFLGMMTIWDVYDEPFATMTTRASDATDRDRGSSSPGTSCLAKVGNLAS